MSRIFPARLQSSASVNFNMLRYSPNKDLNALANDALRDGWSITFTGSGHLRWLPPNGNRPFFSSATPSCAFAVKKIRNDMKRAMEGYYNKPKEQEQVPMNNTLTHKIQIPNGIVTTSMEPKMKPNLPVPLQKETIFLQTARKRVREMVEEGKSFEDSITVLFTAFDVIDSFRRPASKEMVLKAAQAEWNVRGSRKPKALEPETVVEQVAPTPVVVKAKPAPKQVSGDAFEGAVQHLRSVLSLPLDKQKKIEIMIDILEKVL